jgi:hypothetical protein
MAKKEDAAIYIDNNRILFYIKGAVNTLGLNLGADIVADLEVINREKFEHALDNFFQTPTLKGKEFNVTVIFSRNTTFEKELTGINSKAEFEETQRFLDMVPFEEVLSNSYRINKKTKVVAANKILYNILKQALDKNSAHIGLVLAMTVLVTANPELSQKVDLPLIVGKLESFKQYSLIDFEEMGLSGEVANSIGIKKKDVRLYALIFVMIGLFLVLIFMIYTTIIAPPAPVKNNLNKTPKAIITPVESLEDVPIATEDAQISTPSAF